jgi:hypothetical protein
LMHRNSTTFLPPAAENKFAAHAAFMIGAVKQESFKPQQGWIEWNTLFVNSLKSYPVYSSPYLTLQMRTR